MYWPRKWFIRMLSENTGQRDVYDMSAFLFKGRKGGRTLRLCVSVYICVRALDSRSTHTTLKSLTPRVGLK